MRFGGILASVLRRKSPVIGCRQSTSPGRLDAGVCLGWLCEEHFCALASVVQRPVQLDLTHCCDCDNAHVPEALRRRLQAAQDHSLLPVLECIHPITDPDSLTAAGACIGRRTFLGLWRAQSGFGMPELPAADEQPAAGAVQRSPHRRRLLQWVGDRATPEVRKALACHFHGRVTLSKECNACGDCVAVCPTGALTQSAEDEPPQFTPANCVSCRACECFCPEDAITVDTALSVGLRCVAGIGG